MNKLERFTKLRGLALCLVFIFLSASTLVGKVTSARNGQQATNMNKAFADLTQLNKGKQAAAVATVKVILQVKDKPGGRLNAPLNRNGDHARREGKSPGTLALDITPNIIDESASFAEVADISLDRKTESLNHLSYTTGAQDAAGQKVYEAGIKLGEGIVLRDGIIVADEKFVADGRQPGDRQMQVPSVLFDGDNTAFTQVGGDAK